jgi:hypothetical protein
VRKKLAAEYGVCSSADSTITLDSSRTNSPARTRNTFEHEVAHAAMEESGAHYLLTKMLDGNEKQAHECEELLIRMFVPAFLAALETAR